MRLGEFISTHIEEIAAEWEKFARTLLPEKEFSASVLRNGIKGMLREIGMDMEKAQTDNQQKRKSEGMQQSRAIESVLEEHVVERIKMGLTSRQLISEFRALRASVIRLWQEKRDVVHKEDLYDLTRFNEAVDESLIEAEVHYSRKVNEARELFLGILGHDLRNPLHAISGSAELIMRAPTHDKNKILAGQILASAGRMTNMIADLIELSRIQLGKGISIHPVKIDMRDICAKVIEEMNVVYPDRVFVLKAEKNLLGNWDELKLIRVLSNLIGNAVQHGSADSEIVVIARKSKNGVALQVHNNGPAIPKKIMPKLFERFVQEKSSPISGSVGLGLYIAKEIVTAHGGTIDAHSCEIEGTTFSAYLPQKSRQPASIAYENISPI